MSGHVHANVVRTGGLGRSTRNRCGRRISVTHQHVCERVLSASSLDLPLENACCSICIQTVRHSGEWSYGANVAGRWKIFHCTGDIRFQRLSYNFHFWLDSKWMRWCGVDWCAKVNHFSMDKLYHTVGIVWFLLYVLATGTLTWISHHGLRWQGKLHSTKEIIEKNVRMFVVGSFSYILQINDIFGLFFYDNFCYHI